MLKVLFLMMTQCVMLAGGQVFLKFALARMKPFAMSWDFFLSVLTNWQFACCGLCFGCGSILWLYIIKHYPLSVAYPLTSLSFVFGLLAAIIFFHEDVQLVKWAGVMLIVAGCCLIAK